MTRIEQTHYARDDIESAFIYLLERNPSAAQKLKLRLARAVQLLAARPLMGRERPELHAQLRSFVLHPYVLFYVPLSNGIRVVRFLHGSRDIEAILHNQPTD
jgi:toxin ParE1/3/4